jgi:RNA polymerase sigma-70 factor (ECF subfamily)
MNPPHAFTELYQRYSETVYHTALRVTGNPADAEDVLQTVFMRVFHHGERLDPQQMPERYLRRAATNAALDILRARVRRPEAELNESLAQASPDASPLLKESLRRAIATLDEKDAELFTLRYVTGVTNTEIAEMYGLERSTIGVRLHRIRQWLQAELER